MAKYGGVVPAEPTIGGMPGFRGNVSKMNIGVVLTVILTVGIVRVALVLVTNH